MIKNELENWYLSILPVLVNPDLNLHYRSQFTFASETQTTKERKQTLVKRSKKQNKQTTNN